MGDRTTAGNGTGQCLVGRTGIEHTAVIEDRSRVSSSSEPSRAAKGQRTVIDVRRAGIGVVVEQGQRAAAVLDQPRGARKRPIALQNVVLFRVVELDAQRRDLGRADLHRGRGARIIEQHGMDRAVGEDDRRATLDLAPIAGCCGVPGGARAGPHEWLSQDRLHEFIECNSCQAPIGIARDVDHDVAGAGRHLEDMIDQAVLGVGVAGGGRAGTVIHARRIVRARTVSGGSQKCDPVAAFRRAGDGEALGAGIICEERHGSELIGIPWILHGSEVAVSGPHVDAGARGGDHEACGKIVGVPRLQKSDVPVVSILPVDFIEPEHHVAERAVLRIRVQCRGGPPVGLARGIHADGGHHRVQGCVRERDEHGNEVP